MATIPQIRDAIKTRLDTVSGLNVYDTVPGQVHTPAAIIRRRSGPRPSTLGATNHDYTFVVTVLTSLADDRAAQDKLDAFLSGGGADSIMAAIDADPDLGSVVEFAQIADIEADQVIEYAGGSYVGADIVIDLGAA